MVVVWRLGGISVMISGINLFSMGCQAVNTGVVTPPAPFDPINDVDATIELWHDASDASTLFAGDTGSALSSPDGVIARWVDKSGNQRTATQTINSLRPQRKTNIQNGLDMVLFNGSRWFVNRTFNVKYVVTVAQTLETKAFAGLFTGTNSELILNSSGNGVINVHGANVNGDSTLSVTNGVTFLWSINRETAVNTSRTFGQEFNTTGSARSWNGYCGEIICYSTTPSEADQRKLLEYLQAKWATPALPAP